MMDPIRLHILSPGGVLVETQASAVSLPGTLGPFEVLPGHAPILSSLEAGEVIYVSEGVRKVLSIRGGFAEVAGDGVEICAEV